MEMSASLRRVVDRISPLSFGVVARSLDGGEPWAAGSGVFIAPYLGLTAKHVVEGTWNHFEPDWRRNKWPRQEERASHFLVLTQKLYFGREEEATWVVEEVTPVPWTDLMLLRISPQNELAHQYRWGCGFLGMQLLPPPVDEEVWVFGYPDSHAESHPEKANMFTGDFQVAIHRARISTVEDFRRDSLKDFPGFEFVPGVEGGGSGGPVVWEDKLCGIASVGWKGEGLHAGYAAALWPAIFARVRWPPGDAVLLSQLMREPGFMTLPVDLDEVERRAFLEPEDGILGPSRKRPRLRAR